MYKTKRSLVVLIGCAALAGCSKKEPVKSVQTADTPHGQYEWKETTYQPGTKKIASVVRELSAAELNALREDANAATDFIAKYAPESKSSDELPFTLDLAFAGWMKSKDSQKEQDERVIRIVGAAFGFYCIEKLELRWAITQDEHGTDTALVRSNPETQSFPFSSIRYRVEDQKTDFIYGLYLSIERLIQQASAEKPKDKTPH